MSSGYQEFKPSAELQQYVECYWLHRFETEGERESAVQRCMPFGSCRKFGIRLRPESALELFRIPIAPLFNQFTDVESYFGKEINRLVDDVYGVRDMN